jgi:signal transduction histidine kinase
VTDLVVELGDGPASSVRDALAAALGDPTLEVGYAIDGTDQYIDMQGTRIDLASPEPGRVVTPIEVDGRRVAVIVHDPAVLDDPGLAASIAEAAALAAANARLQAEVRGQVVEVAASRGRLVRAEDEERHRIGRMLRDGPEARLAAIAAILADVERVAAGASAITLERTADASTQVERAMTDLRALAAGLHPAGIDLGLGAAIHELAARAPVRIDIDVDEAVVPRGTATAAYYVASEGIANVLKHAGATRARIAIHVDAGRVAVEVVDDGTGGANPDGAGLRGLADRVEALGGRLTIASPPGGGTRLAAELPLDGEA